MLNLHNCNTVYENGNWVVVVTKDKRLLHINTKPKTITKNKYMELLALEKTI